MTTQNQRQMLSLARAVLENELLNSGHDLSAFQNPTLDVERGLFVTLTIGGELRGCIGMIEAADTLYNNIVEMSKSAAFNDHRFPPLTVEELDRARIEISILTIPKELRGSSTLDKMAKLRPNEDGVILSAGPMRATFLPQVWEQLPRTEDFISHLCRKAGLPSDYWEQNELTLMIYQVEHFEE